MANEIMDEMKKKVFYSCFSGTECIFVDSIDNLSEQQLNDKTACYFDGMNLIDNVN